MAGTEQAPLESQHGLDDKEFFLLRLATQPTLKFESPDAAVQPEPSHGEAHKNAPWADNRSVDTPRPTVTSSARLCENIATNQF